MSVRHICISDLHCGAENSLLTPETGNPGKANALSRSVGAALKATIKALAPPKSPDLVLLGDVVDLSFASPSKASATLAGFLGEIAKDKDGSDVYDSIVFVPGNHDHELWTAERFSHRSSSPGRLSAWSHTSPAFKPPGSGTPSTVLDDVLRLADIKTPLHTYYPNYGLYKSDHDRAILFHHGHFFESEYTAMSRLQAALSGGPTYPATLDELEQTNGAWIDFIWSTIGDAGQLGRDATMAYQYLLTGGAAAFFQHRLARLLTTTMLSSLPIPSVGATAEGLGLLNSAIVDSVVGKFGQLARFSYTRSLSASTAEGLLAYMAGPAKRQFAEIPNTEKPDTTLPKDVTLVFGHTHKPFEDRMVVPPFSGAMGIVNTGGWVLDTALLCTVEGASAIFIDDDLNVAALRLFAPPANDQSVAVTISGVDGADTKNPMITKLRAALEATKDVWDDVENVAAKAYQDKQSMIIKMMKQADADARRKETLL